MEMVRGEHHHDEAVSPTARWHPIGQHLHIHKARLHAKHCRNSLEPFKLTSSNLWNLPEPSKPQQKLNLKLPHTCRTFQNPLFGAFTGTPTPWPTFQIPSESPPNKPWWPCRHFRNPWIKLQFQASPETTVQQGLRWLPLVTSPTIAGTFLKPVPTTTRTRFNQKPSMGGTPSATAVEEKIWYLGITWMGFASKMGSRLSDLWLRFFDVKKKNDKLVSCSKKNVAPSLLLTWTAKINNLYSRSFRSFLRSSSDPKFQCVFSEV